MAEAFPAGYQRGPSDAELLGFLDDPVGQGHTSMLAVLLGKKRYFVAFHVICLD
jgi:hypothetical protein